MHACKRLASKPCGLGTAQLPPDLSGLEPAGGQKTIDCTAASEQAARRTITSKPNFHSKPVGNRTVKNSES